MTPQEIEAMQKTFGEFKTANETALAEMKTLGHVTGETNAKIDKINAAFDGMETKINTRMDTEAKAASDREKALETRLGDIEKLLAKKAPHLLDKKEEAKSLDLEQRRVFFKAVCSGMSKHQIDTVLTPEERKVLILGNDTTGGYLAPAEYVMEMLMNQVEFSPFRSLCRVRTTTRPQIQIPKRTQTAAATWVAEVGTRAETQNPAWGLETITVHELYAMAKASKQDLEDTVFDLQGFLNAEFAEQFGVTEAVAFCSGTGTGQPEGLLTNASVSQVVSGDANLLTADGLIDLYFYLKEVYLANATWAWSRSTLKGVRKMKDGNGNYIWSPGIKTDARPATVLDRPYVTAIDMPTVTANAFPVLFGDFKRAYMIVDRLEIEMMMDPYTSKNSGMVEFTARKRVGGQVVLAEAIVKQKIST